MDRLFRLYCFARLGTDNYVAFDQNFCGTVRPSFGVDYGPACDSCINLQCQCLLYQIPMSFQYGKPTAKLIRKLTTAISAPIFHHVF